MGKYQKLDPYLGGGLIDGSEQMCGALRVPTDQMAKRLYRGLSFSKSSQIRLI